MNSGVLGATIAYTGHGENHQVTITINIAELVAHGVHVTMTTMSDYMLRFQRTVFVPAAESDVVSDLKWAALLSDSRSLALLEQMGAEALAEDDAGLTWDIDELL